MAVAYRLAPVLCIALAALAQPSHSADLTVEPYQFRTYDGSAHAAELGHLRVPEDRSRPGSHTIEVAFIRLKSSSKEPRSPIVFLPGGPGIPGSVLGRVPVYYELLAKLQAIADVILLDQRGIGMSTPNTACPDGPPPPPDVFASEARYRDALTASARACAEFWRAKGVDPSAYTTAASADDIDDLRRALGAEKLSLLAHSYGTALALETMRRHGAGIDRVVLAGVEGPDRALQLPLVADFALRRLSTMAAAAPALHGAFPDTYGEFGKLVDRLDHEPLTVHFTSARTKQTVALPVGSFLLRMAIRDMLPNGRKAGRIPAIVYSLAHGDDSLLAPLVQGIYDDALSGMTAMQFAVYCSDGASPWRRRAAEEQAPHSVFGDVSYFQLDSGLCQAAGAASPAPASLLPEWSSVQALLVSGNLDSNTPLYDAEEVLGGLARGEMLRVDNGFHETLPADAVQSVVADFFGGATIGRRSVTLAPLQFLTIEQAKAPPPSH